jgi:hypothetical protein
MLCLGMLRQCNERLGKAGEAMWGKAQSGSALARQARFGSVLPGAAMSGWSS